MRALVTAALIVLPAGAVAAQSLPSRVVPPPCRTGADKAAATRFAKPQRLGELPPASQVLAVWRTDERGCSKPVVLARGIGANPERAVSVEGDARP